MSRRGDWRCLIGLHRRSGSRVFRDGSDIRSLCRRCGRPMIKRESGWRLARPEDDRPSGPDPD
jgi:hypothetical protein